MASNRLARIIKLEERRSRGCDACRRWTGVALVDDDGCVSRPECCPGCGRCLPVREWVHLVGIPLDAV